MTKKATISVHPWILSSFVCQTEEAPEAPTERRGQVTTGT